SCIFHVMLAGESSESAHTEMILRAVEIILEGLLLELPDIAGDYPRRIDIAGVPQGLDLPTTLVGPATLESTLNIASTSVPTPLLILPMSGKTRKITHERAGT
ncbi:hypothetical protein ACJX0J_020609, partial [Zea mays]